MSTRTKLSPARRNEVLADLRDRKRFRVPPSQATAKKMFLYCHYCGFTPPDGMPQSGLCPKCGGSCWERYALSRRLVPPHMM